MKKSRSFQMPLTSRKFLSLLLFAAFFFCSSHSLLMGQSSERKASNGPNDENGFFSWTIAQPGVVLQTNWRNVDGTSGMTQLIWQGDGNLVLYKEGVVKFATNTENRGHRVTWQGDGNLVVYDVNEQPLWDSGTYEHDTGFWPFKEHQNSASYFQIGEDKIYFQDYRGNLIKTFP